MHDPANAMSSFVLAQIDAAIELFVSVIKHGAATPRYQRNLQWLLKLRARAAAKIESAASGRHSAAPVQGDSNPFRQQDSAEGEDLELLGWRTRLISRTGHERQTVQTIRVPATPTGSHTTAFSNQNADPANVADAEDQLRMAEMLTSNTSLPLSTADSTDELVCSNPSVQKMLKANCTPAA